MTISFLDLSWKEVECYITGHDLRRLEKYSKNIVDRHLITDLITPIATLFASRKLKNLHLSGLQAVSIHLSMKLHFMLLLTDCNDTY